MTILFEMQGGLSQEAQRGNRRRIQIRILGQGNRGKPQGEDNKICVRWVWDVGAKDVSRREHGSVGMGRLGVNPPRKRHICERAAYIGRSSDTKQNRRGCALP